MDDSTTQNGNDKVTIKLLAYRIDNLEKKIDSIERKLDAFIEAMHAQDTKLVDHDTRIKTDHDEIEKLRSTTKAWDITTAIGTVIAAILGALGMNNK